MKSLDLTAIRAGQLNAEREILLGEGSKLLLLDSERNELERIESSWSLGFDRFLSSPVFNIAITDAAFNSKVEDAAFLLVIDSSNASLNNQLHAINRETTMPAGVKPYWRIAAAATGKRYTPV
jgi:hypothetical protein